MHKDLQNSSINETSEVWTQAYYKGEKIANPFVVPNEKGGPLFHNISYDEESDDFIFNGKITAFSWDLVEDGGINHFYKQIIEKAKSKYNSGNLHDTKIDNLDFTNGNKITICAKDVIKWNQVKADLLAIIEEELYEFYFQFLSNECKPLKVETGQVVLDRMLIMGPATFTYAVHDANSQNYRMYLYKNNKNFPEHFNIETNTNNTLEYKLNKDQILFLDGSLNEEKNFYYKQEVSLSTIFLKSKRNDDFKNTKVPVYEGRNAEGIKAGNVGDLYACDNLKKNNIYFVSELGLLEQFEPVYKIENNCLKVYLTIFKKGSIKRGSGGYAMRADAPDEVDYKWCGNLALGIALDLDIEQLIDSVDKYRESLSGGFIETNYPRRLKWNKPTKIHNDVDMQSEICYLKKFKDYSSDSIKRKNLPSTWPAPHNLNFYNAKDQKTTLRKKQKPNVLNHGNPDDRIDAGTVMGQYLLQFLAGDTYKVRKLPATNFAKVAIGEIDHKDLFSVSNSKSKSITSESWGNHRRNAWVENEKYKQAVWKNENNDEKYYLKVRTNQEWCHLYGHGDGGNETFENFVSGSNHCNTEQLAIETGQRYAKVENLTSRVTSYVFPHEINQEVRVRFEDVKECLEKLGLEITITLSNKRGADEKQKRILSVVPSKKSNIQNGDIKNLSELFSNLNIDDDNHIEFPKKLVNDIYNKRNEATKKLADFITKKAYTYPLAKWIRYKLYIESQKEKKKIFDHIFDAQSESFNLHEAKILDHTVRRVIAQSAEKDHLIQYIAKVNIELRKNILKICQDKDKEVVGNIIDRILKQNFNTDNLGNVLVNIPNVIVNNNGNNDFNQEFINFINGKSLNNIRKLFTEEKYKKQFIKDVCKFQKTLNKKEEPDRSDELTKKFTLALYVPGIWKQHSKLVSVGIDKP
jgi:hypothetical protein